MQFQELLQKRSSVRAFKPKAVEQEKLEQAMSGHILDQALLVGLYQRQ